MITLCHRSRCCALLHNATQQHLFSTFKFTHLHTKTPSKHSRSRILPTYAAMQFPKFDIFASKEFVESLAKQKKVVRFTPDTDFTPGRPHGEFQRAHPKYLPGKHSCPAEFGGEWENTSKMTDLEYQLLHMIVHSQHRVRDEPEAAALSNSYKLYMRAGHPLPLGSEIPLNLSKFRDPVLVRFRKILSDPAVDIRDEWNNAKALTVFKDHDGKFMFF
jgi:hypothetical protein